MKYNIILYFPSNAELQGKIYSIERSEMRHSDFISHFPKEKFQFYLSRHISEHLGENVFIPSYIRVGDHWEKNEQQVYGNLVLGPHKDITWDNIFHNPISGFCKDKTKIELLLPEYSFHSQLCENYSEIEKKFFRVSSHIKVLKPVYGSKGNGILFCENIPKMQEIDGNFPYLIQDFFDTSNGFFGYAGIHDFRTIILNGKITGSFLRLAAPGNFTANVDKGAEIVDFGEHGVPDAVKEIIQKADSLLSKSYPERYYSLDVGRGKDGSFKIFELNANPMLSTPSIRKNLALFIQKKYFDS